MSLSPLVKNAIKSGHVPKLRDWRSLPVDKMTQGEKVCAFIERHVIVPEGDLVGQKMKLLEFQEAFIQSIFDGEVRARKAICSVGRKAGKTTVISSLLLAFMFMKDLINKNSRINSAALSKEQAALVFNYMSKSLQQSPTLQGLFRIIPSGKRIVSLTTGIEFQSLAAESSKAMGLSPAVLVGDEWGSVVGNSGAQYDFIQSLLTAQGAHSNPLAIIISTSAASDADWLSTQIDDAIRAPSKDVVCHYYTADKELAIDDPKAWEQACPAIGAFRSRDDVRMQAEQALRMPTAQASFENLILNRRVSLEALFLAPQIWKANGKPYDMDVFRNNDVIMGCDLSRVNDLTCVTLASKDQYDDIHVKCYSFSPLDGIKDRASRDRTPYDLWAKNGTIYAPPGKTLDYEMIATWLKNEFEKEQISISSIQFDKWSAKEFFAACDRVGFATNVDRVEVSQGFVGISPRVQALETALLQEKIRHGNNQPVLNLGAASAIVSVDANGNRKLAKDKSSQKIDGLISMLMAVYPLMAQLDQPIDINAMIG